MLTLPLLLLLLGGCEKKEEESSFQEQHRHSEKNTTSSDRITQENNAATITSNTPDHNDTGSSIPQIPGATTHYLKDSKKEEMVITVDPGGRLYFSDKAYSVVVLNFFSPWSHPCKSQLTYLADLQKEYTHSLHIVGVALNPHKHTDQLKEIGKKAGEDLFIADGKTNNDFAAQIFKFIKIPDSIPVPLTIIYHNGIYYRHYEGAVPIEMIKHDIETIIKQGV